MGSGESLHAVETVILLLLVLVAAFAAVARRLKVPYPIVLVLAGLMISFVPRMPRVPLDPNIVFVIFLPPLLFASAWAMSWREFRRNAVVIGSLAVGLVGFTVWGVAEFSDRFITALDWKAGFLLGAVISTTDAIGLLIGVVVGWMEKFIDDGPVELVVSLVVPYAAYLAGERAHASGVLAVVACGIYMSRKSTQFFSAAVRLQVNGAWEALVFMLNGLVFVLIGLQLPYVLAGIHGRYGIGTLIFYGSVFSAVLILLRMIWVFPAVKIASFAERRWLGHRDEEELKPREVFVVGWTGMRGVLALAAAISVPEVLWNGKEFEARNLIVFLAFCVIFVTLVLQGLTLPALIRGLGLAGTTGMEPEEREARRAVLKSAIRYLEEGRRSSDGPVTHLYDDLVHRYRHKLAHMSAGEEESVDGLDQEAYSRLRVIAEGALQAERRTLIELRDRGRISDDVLRTLERELDLAETQYQGIPLS